MTNLGVSGDTLSLCLGECRGGTRQVIMTRISWATHVLQGGEQREATVEARANPENSS